MQALFKLKARSVYAPCERLLALVVLALLSTSLPAQSETATLYTAIDCSLLTLPYSGGDEDEGEIEAEGESKAESEGEAESKGDVSFDADYNAALCQDVEALMQRYLAANKKLKSAEIKREFVAAGLHASGTEPATWVTREESPVEAAAVEELATLVEVLSTEKNSTAIEEEVLKGGSPMIFGFNGQLRDAGTGTSAVTALKEGEYLLIGYLQGKIPHPDSVQDGLSPDAATGLLMGTSMLGTVLSGGRVSITGSIAYENAPYKHLSVVVIDSDGEVAYSNIKGRDRLGIKNRCRKYADKVEKGTTDYTARELLCSLRLNKADML